MSINAMSFSTITTGSTVHDAIVRYIDLHQTVIDALEDAGRTLAMLPMPKHGTPAAPGSAWPEVIQDFWDVMGRADTGTVEERQMFLAQTRNQVRFAANRRDVDRLDAALSWLWMVKMPHHRRTIAARMLVNPLTMRHLYSWSKLGRAFGCHYTTVQSWHNHGIQDIVEGLATNTTR